MKDRVSSQEIFCLLHLLFNFHLSYWSTWVFLFLLKSYFYYFIIGKTDIQRGETERKIFCPMIHSPSERNGPILCQSEARSFFWVSHAGAGSQSFGLSSGHKQGAGWEVGLPGLEPAAIWDPGCARRGP